MFKKDYMALMAIIETPLNTLRAHANPEKAAKMRAYHKTDREVLGVANPEIDKLVREFRKTPEEDLQTADALWQSGIFEARIMAAKLLTRGKLSDELDSTYWRAIMGYAQDFDLWAIADAMAGAAHKRILKPENRYLDLKAWTHSNHLFTKRAVMVYTLPFARLKSPNKAQSQAIETILGWAGEYTQDNEWFIQKSVAWWLRDFSKKNPNRAQTFLKNHGAQMKPFARKEAAKYI